MLRDGWDEAARQNAMFNILTSTTAWVPQQFFDNGREEIGRGMQRLDKLRLNGPRKRALDFGCGVGRCTQALAENYVRVDGVDISAEMVKRAYEYRPPANCRFHVNDTADLKQFRTGTFDLVYSYLVLQHMPQNLAASYVREFVRILKPGGVAMFEAPDGPDMMQANHWLSMYGMPRQLVEEWLHDAGALVIDVELLDESSIWNCYVYTARKRDRA